MLISCPTCPKVYQVAASAIPPEGREVRCAACGSVWFEAGVEADLVETAHQGGSSEDEFYGSVANIPAPTPFSPTVDDGLEAGDSLFSAPTGPVLDAVYVPPSTMDGGAGLTDDDRVTARPVEPSFVGETDGLLGEGEAAPTHPSSTSMAVTVRLAPPVAATAADKPKRHWSPPPEMGRALWSPMAHLWAGLKDTASRFGKRDAQNDPPASPGAAAAAQFRARARAHARNRLTPIRALGWSLWAATFVGLVFGVTMERAWVEDHWPRASNLYALFDGASSDPVHINSVRSRYAQSPQGPVLEMRGVIVNTGKSPILPHLTLTAQDAANTPLAVEPVVISEVPIPGRGERPFVIRARVPEGTRTAHLTYSPSISAPPRERFVLQQTGSGWGQALPDDAISNGPAGPGSVR